MVATNDMQNIDMLILDICPSVELLLQANTDLDLDDEVAMSGINNFPVHNEYHND